MDDNHQVADAVRPEAANCGCPMTAARARHARRSQQKTRNSDIKQIIESMSLLCEIKL